MFSIFFLNNLYYVAFCMVGCPRRRSFPPLASDWSIETSMDVVVDNTKLVCKLLLLINIDQIIFFLHFHLVQMLFLPSFQYRPFCSWYQTPILLDFD